VRVPSFLEEISTKKTDFDEKKKISMWVLMVAGSVAFLNKFSLLFKCNQPKPA
jgi:hypothetical protein